MLMLLLLLAPPLPGGLLAQEAQAGKQDTWIESRYDRVHFRNGNFIDGKLLANTRTEVVLRLKYGEMTVRWRDIARLEVVKVRQLEEKPEERRKPKEPAKPGEPQPSAVERTKPIAPPDGRAPARRSASIEPFPAAPEVKATVDRILEELAKAAPDHKYSVSERLDKSGTDAGPYVASLLETLDDSTLNYAAAAVGRMKDRRTLPVLTSLLASPAAPVRTEAVSLIGELGEGAGARALRPLLSDPDPIVRGTALQALQKIGDRDTFAAVTAIFADPDRSVRGRALDAAFSLSQKLGLEEELLRALEGALERTRGPARGDVLGAVGKAGKPQLWTIVSPHLRDDSSEVRAQAASALGQLGAPESAEALLDQLPAEREYWPRIQISVAASQMKLMKAAPPLIDWLDDPDINIRTAASSALRGITGQNFGTDASKWIEWWEKAKPSD